MNKQYIDEYIGKEVVVRFEKSETLQGTLYRTSDPMFMDHPILPTLKNSYVLLPGYNVFKGYKVYKIWTPDCPPDTRIPSKCPGYDTLYDLYINQQKSLQSIGSIYGVSRERVRQWIRENKIPSRPNGALSKLNISRITATELTECVNSHMTIPELAAHFKIPTQKVPKVLKQFGLYETHQSLMIDHVKEQLTKPIPVDKETLQELYQNNTVAYICDLYHINLPTLYRWFNRYNIPKKGFNSTPNRRVRKPKFPYDKEQFIEDYHTMKVADCAAKYNMAVCTVYLWIHRFDEDTKSNKSL